MKLLVDTNVLVNYLLNNPLFYDDCKAIIERVAKKDDYEIISASAMTDIFYIVNRQKKDSFNTQELLSELMKIVHVASVTENDIKYALELKWSDFEDAVQYSVALSNGVDVIVTYNTKDYQNASIPVMTPIEFLEQYNT